MQWETSAEKAWTFATHLIEYSFVGVPIPFDLYIYERRVTQYELLRFVLVNSLVFAALFKAQKACLKGDLLCSFLQDVK